MRPFVQGCTPLAPERKDPSFEMTLKLLSFFISLFLFVFLALSLSLSPRSPFSFSSCILRSLSYSSRRGACDHQPGTRRELLLAPGTGASPLTFRTIRELPVLLLRGCVSKTTPRQYSAAIERFIERIRVSILALVATYCVGSLASWMMRLVLDVYSLSLSFDEPLTCKFPLERSSLYLSRVM